MKLTGIAAERIKGIEGEALDNLVIKSLRDLIMKASDASPLVLIVEDLHWIDTSSLEMLETLFSLVMDHRILFINVFRPHYQETGERLLQEIEEKHSSYHTIIRLHRLDIHQSDQLIDNLLRIKELPGKIKELIKRRAEGNPFYIEEVIRSFIDEGVIELKNGVFSITEKMKSITIPHTIQAILLSRIDKLDDKTRSLLRIASVIGRSFLHKILEDVAEQMEDIDNEITYLKEIQLIQQVQKTDEVEYLFKQALAQEATYESILVQKRKQLHLKVAESIERVFRDRLHEFYGMLAYHFSQAEEQEKTEEYMLKAADEALKSSASSEAINYYQKVLDLYAGKYQDQVNYPHQRWGLVSPHRGFFY